MRAFVKDQLAGFGGCIQHLGSPQAVSRLLDDTTKR